MAIKVENERETVYYILKCSTHLHSGSRGRYISGFFVSSLCRVACNHTIPQGKVTGWLCTVLKHPTPHAQHMVLKCTQEAEMSNLISYQFNPKNEVRVINNQWFVASDICKGLEIADAAQAVRHINKQLSEAGIKEAFSKRIPVQTNGGIQDVVCVNETGLNLLIMQSRKKEAILFKWWIASEVLPSIRKTGTYSLTLSKQQQYLIKEAVIANVAKTGRTYQAVYRSLYAKFNVPRYQDILAKDFDAAIVFLNTPQINANKQLVLPDINQDGRWLVIVQNNTVTHVKNINNCNCVDAGVLKKLRMQIKKQAEYLVELAYRMRVIDGDCDYSRLDVPIEESHPSFII